MSNRQRWLYTAAILVMMMFLAAMHQLRPAQLSDMIGYYGLSDSVQGLPASMYSMGLFTAMLLGLRLTGRIRKPLLMLFAFIASALTLLPQYLMPRFGVFLAMNLLMGIAFGLLDSLTSANMADLHTGRRGTIMMSMLHGAYGIGGIIAPMAYLGLMSDGMAWNTLFLVAAAVGGILLIYVGPVSLKQTAVTDNKTVEVTKITLATLKSFFSDRMMVAYVAILFCFAVFFNGMINWLVRFVEVTYDSKISGTVLSCVFIGVTAGRLLIPLLPIKIDKFFKFAGFTYTALMLASLVIGSDIATAVCCCAANAVMGPTVPYVMSMACARMPSNTLLVSTMLNMALAVGQIVVAPIMGALEGAFGLTFAMAFAHVFAAVCSIIAIINFRSKKTPDAGG